MLKVLADGIKMEGEHKLVFAEVPEASDAACSVESRPMTRLHRKVSSNATNISGIQTNCSGRMEEI